jgi:hypothetical protein
MDILHAMQDAKYVQVDGEVFATGYLCTPDDRLRADDIVLEASCGDSEVDLTLAEVRDAAQLEPGVFRLRSGSVVAFLTRATIH